MARTKTICFHAALRVLLWLDSGRSRSEGVERLGDGANIGNELLVIRLHEEILRGP